MHGLINRSIERFVQDHYGSGIWAEVAADAALGLDTFEPMLAYDPDTSEALLTAVAKRLAKPRHELLEDLGNFLVTGSTSGVLRRLLRFGGQTFEDFLFSLDELPERALLVLPNVRLPDIEVRPGGASTYWIICAGDWPGFSSILKGALHALADDYGVLVTLDYAGAPETGRLIASIHDTSYNEERPFGLASHLG